MFQQLVTTFLRQAALALALAAASNLAAAGQIHVTLDTGSFGITDGYIDMQLSAAGGVPLANALVSDLSGFDPETYVDSWGVTPSGNGYLFRNDLANDLFQAARLGGILSFDLSFAGDYDPATRYVSHFVVSAYDAGGNPLGAYDPFTGALADFSWTPALAAGSDGTIGVHISDTDVVGVVPEPANALLVAAGLLALAITRRRSAAGPASLAC
jgi:hypothetical protein